MNGLVFTGNRLQEEIGGYDLVVFLMKGGYQDEPLKTLESLYYETMTIVDIENLYDFLAKHGFVGRYRLVDLWTRSGLCFKRFMEMLKIEYNKVFLNLKLSILDKDLLDVLEKLNKRQGNTIIVGESNRVPLFYIQLCLDDDSDQIIVVNDVSFLYRITDSKLKHCLLIINGDLLTKTNNLKVPEGIPVFITQSKNCFYLPDWVDTRKNEIFMTVDMSDKTICVKPSAKFAF